MCYRAGMGSGSNLGVYTAVVNLIIFVVVGGLIGCGILWWKATSWWGSMPDRQRLDAQRRWHSEGAYPLTVAEVYSSDAEYSADLARMRALHYRVETWWPAPDGIHVHYSYTPVYQTA